MKKKILIFVSIISCLFVSCGNEPSNTTFTITWKNENGNVLEVDENVEKGSIPTYNGVTPTKEGNEQYSYTFSGWSPDIKEVYEDATYTAVFTSNINKYTVIWKNDNGDVLEVDNDVPYGTIPTYDGETPTKEGNEDITYIFSGWTSSISEVIQNTTYIAKFTEISNDSIPGIFPVLSDDKTSIEYGFYPQTYVNNTTLITELNNLQPSLNEWYLYNGDYYIKETAQTFNSESYTFNDGTTIVNNTEYWFKCEPIKWNILSNGDGTYYLLSQMLLDVHNFYKDYTDRIINNQTIFSNNYAQSDIRTWLNNDFFNSAFALNNAYIVETNINNDSSTTNSNYNQYVCENTNDKVYLSSYQDYLNLNYGFNPNDDTTRVSKATDYVKAKGAWCNNSFNSSSYWTRSPSSEYYYCAWNVNSGGYLSTYAVDGDSHCVRPCISIRFSE